MKMKKKISLIFIAIAAMLLGGCTPNNNPSISDSDTNVSESETTSESKPESESHKDSEPTKKGTTTPYNQPNSEAVDIDIKTLTNFGNMGAAGGQTVVKTDTLYRIKGTVQFPTNTTHGNFDIVDASGSILVWGCSIHSSAITKSNSRYTFVNDKTFMDINLQAGDEVILEGLYMSYGYSSGYYKSEFGCYIVEKTTGLVAPISGQRYDSAESYKGNYYDSVSGLTGNNLLKGLHNLMMSTHKTYVTYSSLKNTLKQSDEYENSGQAKCFYTGKKTSTFTREHVWCQSLSGSSSNSGDNLYGESYGGSDIHHIRPVSGDYNSMRSNAVFAPIYGDKSGLQKIPYTNGEYSYISGSVMEPADVIKGDVARIIMYMYMHYSSSICNDASKYSFVGTMNVSFIMGPGAKDSLRLLRYWNSIETHDYAFQAQGNRNPFIDHPSYADLIWA